ncbi:Multidrug and toxin extrusion protein 1-like [Oopsacas minuta]|uniref:Multidrug and toxin extrusion protein n=1 Tax=Oopsacas minuta TaxID=111878 RepID=A0AAV7KIM3_9METZ|nr:Multidrug and toxin extrusion protein 1-like [Oopsacas minuta]
MESIWIFLKEELLILAKLIIPIYFTIFISNINSLFLPAIFAGHIGDVAKNYAVVGLSTCFVTTAGIYAHNFISCAVNTLGSQAYGAGKNKELGTLLQRGLLIHSLMSLTIAIIWINAENILLLLHQSPELSKMCGEFMWVMLPILPAYAIIYPTMRILQVQKIVLPTMIILVSSTLIESILCYVLTNYTLLGIKGIAIAVVITFIYQAIAHLVYIRCSSVWERIWGGFTWMALQKWGQYLYYGFPLLIMTLLHDGVFSLGNIVVGATSSNAAVDLSEYSAVLYIEYCLYVLSSCMNIASSIRVGILVGEDNISRMKKVCVLTTSVTLLLVLVQVSVLLAGSSLWGKMFISDQEVAQGIVNIIFVIAAYQPIDGVVENFLGILVGIGKQWLGIVFPIAFFVIATPSAILLSVVAKLGPLGYWMGIMIAFITRAIYLIPLNLCCVRWNKITSVLDSVSISPENNST